MLMTIPAAARRAGVDAQVLRRAVHAGDIEAIRPGEGVRAPFYVTDEDVDAWARKRALRKSQPQS